MYIIIIVIKTALNVGTVSINENSFKGVTSRFAHLEKFNLNFSSLPFVIGVNLLHPSPIQCGFIIISLVLFYFCKLLMIF